MSCNLNYFNEMIADCKKDRFSILYELLMEYKPVL